MKTTVSLAAGLVIGMAGALYSHSDINDDGSVDVRDFGRMQQEFTGPQQKELESVFVDLTHPAVVPGTSRFIVRSLVVYGSIALFENGVPVFKTTYAVSGSIHPHYVFPGDGALILSGGAQLTITGGSPDSITLMGFIE
jgi:hypothetical protein